VSECNWDASATENIVAIFPPTTLPTPPIISPSNSTQSISTATSTHPPPIAAIAAGASGGALILAFSALMLILRQRRRKANGIKLSELEPPSNTNVNRASILKAELDGSSVNLTSPLHSNIHEVSGNSDLKSPFPSASHAVEIDSYGRKWPAPPSAVEIGESKNMMMQGEIYEMDAGEVAIEMSGIGSGRRRSRGGGLMSFVEGDDWDRVQMSPGGVREMGSPVSALVSPVSPVFRPR